VAFSNFSESKTTDKNGKSIPSNPTTLFANVSSLQDMIIDKLLEEKGKGTLQGLLTYIVRDKGISDVARDVMLNHCRPRFVKHLCNLVVKDKKAETKAMLEVYPDLMFVENEERVQDHVKRIIPRGLSAYRIAWGAGADTMLKIMDSLIDKIPRGRELASAQYKEQFPEAVSESKQDTPQVSETNSENRTTDQSTPKSTGNKPFNFDALVAAITADEFKEEKPNAKTNEELQKFRDYFNPEGKVFASGNHFDKEAFKKALEIYRQNFDPWNWKQCNLFCRQVIGYFERILPACDFLAVCKAGGLISVVDRKEAVPDGDISLNFGSYGELGFDCFVDMYGLALGGRVRCGTVCRVGRMGGVDLANYLEIKNQSLETLSSGCRVQLRLGA